ncbi:MAG: lipopolysaccharide heptosyltransferase II [Candidatus Omnitrophica bacterium]|nr:lipopolysaccharide heptosyltransferase II [Candidatus Omnitrophota bacterium]
MNNILVVNVNWLGDAVFSTPVFGALKDNFPKARVSCLCVPRVQEVLKFCPFIDELIVYDEKGSHQWPLAKWFLSSDLRRRSFDAAFLLHRSTTRALLVYLAGIPIRVGYSKAKNLLTHPVDFNDEGIHRSDLYLEALESYGLKINNRTCRLNLNLEDAKRLDQLLQGKGIDPQEKFMVLHTAGNWPLKRWPAFHFVRLIEGIHDRFNMKVILSGSRGDWEHCQSINQQARHQAMVVAGETTLGQALALYRRAEVMISSDSGPLHLAHSVGANVIGIYGPTRPEVTGPRGAGKAKILFKDVGCNKAPCYHAACTNNICMQTITVDDVLETIQTFIGS